MRAQQSLARYIAIPFCLIAAVMLCLVHPVQASEGVEKKVVSPGGHTGLLTKTLRDGRVRVIVGLDSGAGPFFPALSDHRASGRSAMISIARDRLLSDLARTGRKPHKYHAYEYVPYMAMTVDHATLTALLASSHAVTVHEDIALAAETNWGIARIGAEQLHTEGITGYGYTVAVLDTGCDKTHPYLAGAVASEACYSSGDSSQGISSLCPGGVTQSTAPGSAMPYGGNCPAGACANGTHVAGIVAGRNGVAGQGAAPGSPGPGVAPGARILAIQVYSRFDSELYCGTGSSPCVLAFYSDILKGLERVYALKDTYSIVAANLSLSEGKHGANCDGNPLKPLIDGLWAAGTATVVSTGNEGHCGYIGAPSCVSTAISVGGTDSNDLVGAYSNSASFMSLFAPGSSIDSSIPVADGGGYATWTGTGRASAHVAGAFALLKEAVPTATAAAILNALTSTGVNVTDSKCGTDSKGSSVTKKRINAYDAYHALGSGAILTVAIGGTRRGTVAADGLTCTKNSCTGIYEVGTEVTLTSHATIRTQTPWWSGCASASGNTCRVVMDGSKTVNASFGLPPWISVSPPFVNFGILSQNVTSLPKVVTIRNSGSRLNADVVIESMDITGGDGIRFAYTTNCSTLTAGMNCTAAITATATTLGAKTGQFYIHSNSPRNPAIEVKLSGKAPSPVIFVSPPFLNFGTVTVGSTSKKKPVTVKNTGASDLVIGSVFIDNYYSFSQDNDCGTLARGASCTINVAFAPAYTGLVQAILAISSNDPDRPTVKAPLEGIGIYSLPTRRR
jgi:hypothetical protein